MSSLDGLPDDPSELRAAVLAMRAELEAERALRRGLEDQNERLEHPVNLSLANLRGAVLGAYHDEADIWAKNLGVNLREARPPQSAPTRREPSRVVSR